MTLSLIDVGTTANDGTGDPLRTAFQTVNTALTAVNNAVVVGTGTTTFKDDSGSTGVAVASSGSVIVGDGYFSVQSGATTFAAPLAALNFHYGISSGVASIGPTGATDTNLDFVVSKSSSTIKVVRLNNLGDASFYNAGATVGMTWDASANANNGGLGIGTATPTNNIQIHGASTTAVISLTNSTTGSTGGNGTDIYTSGNGFNIYNWENDDINLYTGGALGLSVIYHATHTTLVKIPNLPTSAAGLAAGTLWNNSGVINVA
jgi:hypothetical protein